MSANYAKLILDLHARIRALEAALESVMQEGKWYAAHNALPLVAQRMYDHAETALALKEPSK